MFAPHRYFTEPPKFQSANGTLGFYIDDDTEMRATIGEENLPEDERIGLELVRIAVYYEDFAAIIACDKSDSMVQIWQRFCEVINERHNSTWDMVFKADDVRLNPVAPISKYLEEGFDCLDVEAELWN